MGRGNTRPTEPFPEEATMAMSKNDKKHYTRMKTLVDDEISRCSRALTKLQGLVDQEFPGSDRTPLEAAARGLHGKLRAIGEHIGRTHAFLEGKAGKGQDDGQDDARDEDNDSNDD
jgi:hypothetical protein